MSVESNTVEREKIRKMMVEISNSMTRIEAERDLIKETINEVCDAYQLDKKVFRKMCRVYHKQTYNEEMEVNEQFENLYELITGETTLQEEN